MAMESKLETVDGYTIVDIDGTDQLVGPIRSAKKVLQRTTTDLVRHATYVCAVHGLNAAGAAVALNYDRKSDADEPFGEFAAEISAWAKESNFSGSLTLGLSPTEAGPALHNSANKIAETIAISASAAVPNEATSIVIMSDGEELELLAELGDRDISFESDPKTALTSGADVVLVRGKTALLDHAMTEGTNVKAIVALQPLTTTARGLAVATRARATIIPDFISAAGPTLAALGMPNAEISTRTAALLAELADSEHLFLAACEKAEAHLTTLTPALPFGRPLGV